MSEKRKLIGMLSALEDQIRKVMAMARALDKGARTETFGEFMAFRRKVDEMRSLSTIIEKRLEDAFVVNADDLRQQFERLDMVMLTMLVRCNKTLFAHLVDGRTVPFGAREALTAEVRFLQDIRERLTLPQYADRIAPSTVADLDEVLAAVQAVVNQSSDLPDFSAEQPLSEWLKDHGRPLHMPKRH